MLELVKQIPSEIAESAEETTNETRARKARERYRGDPEYRAHVLAMQKAAYQKNEALRDRIKHDAAKRYAMIRDTEKERERGRKRYLADKESFKRRSYESKLRKRGLTVADYAALNIAQNAVCAICRRACRTRTKLSVDHDHATGEVRGLLCASCNLGIGKLDYSPMLLRAAADYLEKHK